MRVYRLILIGLVFSVGCCTYPKSTNKEKVEAVGHSNLKLPADGEEAQAFAKLEAFGTGELYLSENALEKASQLTFDHDPHGRLMLSDKYWDTHWLSSVNETKVVFWETEHYSTVRNNVLKAVDVEDMRGFDFTPLIVQMKNVPPWNGGTFKQHFIRIPTKPGQNRNHWKEGKLEYFFMPDGFDYIGNAHLPQFYVKFPDYKLPENKWGATSFVIAHDTLNLTKKKGYTLTASWFDKPKNRIRYDYDQWLYDSGAPQAFTASQEKINEWLEQVDENTLYSNFQKQVIKPYSGFSHVVLDWEAMRMPYGPGLEKLATCMKNWHRANPKSGISFWPHGIFEMNRLNVEGNNLKYQLTRDLKFQGNLDQWRAQLGSQSPMSINGFIVNFADISYVGGYLNYPTNYGFVHHFVMQHMMSKKYFPEKRSVLMWWAHQEILEQFEKGGKWFFDKNGKPLRNVIKPMVFPSAMHNAAVWAFAFCDGGEMWSEPFGRTEEKTFLGDREVYDLAGNKVETGFSSQQSGQYAVQNYQNIDRWEAGKWAVSQNADILEAQTEWAFIPSSKNGKDFLSGDQVLPSFSLYDHTPLAAAKMSKDGQSVLLLVYDAWNQPLKKESLWLKLEDRVVKVDVFGKYTSVIRVELD